MVTIDLLDDILHLHVQGADKVWALKSELSIPLRHVVTARADSEIVHRWRGMLKAPGTAIPGVIRAGTFYYDNKRVFWDIHHPDKALVIKLHDETYNELVVEVFDPDTAAQFIVDAVTKV